MKKSYLLQTIAIILLGGAFILLGSGSYLAKAQAEDTSTPAETETASPTPTETQTPSPTPDLSNLTVIKNYKIANDRNSNGSIDSGDSIAYTVEVKNTDPQTVDLLLQDSLNLEFFELRLENQSPNCIINGANIECSLEQVGAGEVHYTLTFKGSLDFKGNPNLEVINVVNVLFQGVPVASASAQLWVNAPTATVTPSPTITATPTNTPTPTITPTPTTTPTSTAIPSPTPVPPPPGAPALQQGWVTVVIVAFLAVIGIAVFTYVGAIAKVGDPAQPQDINVTRARVALFREGTIIVFIVSAVLLMGIAGTLPSDGVISILSIIVGYVFGRASAGRSQGD